MVEVLNAIYETDFLGFSYGFRPGRSPHQALDALAFAIGRRKVSWILDADIRGYFEHIDRSWMARFPGAPDRGSEGPAPDPEVDERRGDRERGVGRHAGGDATGGFGFTVALPTSTCTMCSTCGPSGGGAGRRAAR